MRILYDHQVTSLQDAGGISRYYFELVQSLLRYSRTEVEPELLLGFNRSILPFTSLRPGARVSSFETSTRPGALRYALNEACTAMASPFRGTFEIYHATYQRVLPWIASRAVVVTHHDSTPEHFPGLFPDAAAIYRRLKKVYEQADRIICISESCRADLLHFFAVPPEKTVVIHHGFSPLPVGQGEDRNGVPCEQPYVLYVGSRAAYKNFPALLKAFSRQEHPDLHLVVAGGGPFRQEEVALIQSLRLGKRMHHLPRVADAQLATLYRNATLFVYPSLYEGFGFPPLEAMSVGCPVLTSRRSALPEICGNAAFYFVPESVDDLAASLAQLLADEELRLSKRQAGFEQVRRYTWQETAARTLDVYHAALQK